MRVIVPAMSGFLGGLKADVPTNPSREGVHAGISYRVEGTGPALMLLPFFLAPSQWAPAVERLARQFTVITLGGAHLGGVATLEDRARAPTYQAMFRTLIDLMAPKPGEAILDVGCGAGSLDRLLARRLGKPWRVPAAPRLASDRLQQPGEWLQRRRRPRAGARVGTVRSRMQSPLEDSKRMASR